MAQLQGIFQFSVSVDALYCFSFVDVGKYESNNDSGIFVNSEMRDLFCQGNLKIPPRNKIF